MEIYITKYFKFSTNGVYVMINVVYLYLLSRNNVSNYTFCTISSTTNKYKYIVYRYIYLFLYNIHHTPNNK